MLTKEVTSLRHPSIKHFVKLREDRKYRLQQGTALISGIKLITELSSSIKTLLILQGFPPPFPIQAKELLIVSEQILKKVTGLKNPEPIAAEIALPPPSNLQGKKNLLVLDGISDPGNLGTLFRTALALSWEGIFLTPHTADPFNEKAIRAAKGATFKIPFMQGSYEELIQLVTENKMELLIADVSGEDASRLGLSSPCALILGNESHGASSLLKTRGQMIAIPIAEEMESLNVSAAGAILMYCLRNG